VCATELSQPDFGLTLADMAVVDAMRNRLMRATALGVPADEFLRRELAEGGLLRLHLNWRVAQAGRETEEAVRELAHELDTPDEAILRLAAKQALGE
jgi:hypothetical protein